MTETMIKLNDINAVRRFIEVTNRHKGDITLFSGKYIIDAKSIMGVFSLDLSKPIKMEVDGEMSLDVKAGMSKFIYNN